MVAGCSWHLEFSVLICESMRINRRVFIKGLLGAAAAGGLSYPTLLEPWSLVVEKVPVKIPALPNALEGFRVVQLSDLHFRPFTTLGQIAQTVEKVNTLAADLVVITGDLITRSGEAIDELAPALARLQARHGVICALGNHDMWHQPARITGRLRKEGIDVLRNQGRTISVGKAGLFIAGVDSIWGGHPDLSAALEKRRSSRPTILLAHEPDTVELWPAEAGVDLQLSGHTHGGQVCLPLVGPPMLPIWGRKYWKGLYRVGAAQVYTNRGIGCTGLPVRFGSMPEITLLELHG